MATSEQDEITHAGRKTAVATEDGVSIKSHRAPAVVRLGNEEVLPDEPASPPDETTTAPKVSDEPQPMAAELEDFEALFAEGVGSDKSMRYEIGDPVRGVVEVVSVNGEEIFLDLGSKTSGYALKEEFLDDDGEVTVSPGDVIEGMVSSIDASGVCVRTSVTRANASLAAMAEAQAAGIPVEGKVTGVNKGGYEVEVATVRAFCPFSQIDVYRPPEPEQFVGQVLQFKISEIKEGRDVVLSRLALLKEQRAAQAEETRALLSPGARMSGTVRSLQSFGAFVDLGGVDGLIHLSELSWSRVNTPAEVLSVGQHVEVVVLEIDTQRDRIALSLRRATDDPFAATSQSLQVGSVVTGTVARLTNFGAFISLGADIDGLVHISDMAHHRVRHPKDLLTVGETVQVKVTEIDMDRRRIGLSLKALAIDPWTDAASRYTVASEVVGMVARIADFGVFVDLEPGLTALLPASESGVPQGKALSTTYKVGKEVTLKVLRVSPQDRKMALTAKDEVTRDAAAPGRGRKGSIKGGHKQSAVAWKDSSEETEGMGSFGALLQAALTPKDGDEG